jgi:CheY-like chemotaxis protein
MWTASRSRSLLVRPAMERCGRLVAERLARALLVASDRRARQAATRLRAAQGAARAASPAHLHRQGRGGSTPGSLRSSSSRRTGSSSRSPASWATMRLPDGPIHLASTQSCLRRLTSWRGLLLAGRQAAGEAEGPARSEVHRDARGARKRLLLVDDEPHNLALLERRLAPLGHELIRAEDGRSAMAAFAEYQPSLVLLDLVMPGMDGMDVLTQIRARAGTDHVPVIVLTAHSERGSRKRADRDALAPDKAPGHLCPACSSPRPRAPPAAPRSFAGRRPR